MKRIKNVIGANILKLLILLPVCVSCTGKLSDEQKKAFKEEMESREIRRIPESDIVIKADRLGNDIIENIDSVLANNPGGIEEYLDSLEVKYNAQINKINTSESYSGEVNDILDAYLFSSENNLKADNNIQKLGNGDLFFSSPVFRDSADTKILEGIWGITFSRKYIVEHLEE